MRRALAGGRQAKTDSCRARLKRCSRKSKRFRFPDGSKIDRAFSYEWRLWSLPELTELLGEAGFSRSTVWWEGTGEDGEGNGEFSPESRGDADAGWVAYIVAEP